LLAASDLNAAKYGLGDPYAYRMSQGLKINPVGAPFTPTGGKRVDRSVRPRLRPQGLGSLP